MKESSKRKLNMNFETFDKTYLLKAISWVYKIIKTICCNTLPIIESICLLMNMCNCQSRQLKGLYLRHISTQRGHICSAFLHCVFQMCLQKIQAGLSEAHLNTEETVQLESPFFSPTATSHFCLKIQSNFLNN